MRIKQASRAAAILSIPLLMAVLSYAGCGDDNNNATGVGGSTGLGGAGGITGFGGSTGVGGATTVDSGTAAATFEINIQNFAFSPADVSVPPGSTVMVHNLDSVSHTVTSEAAVHSFTAGAVSGVSFDTGAIAPGGTATFTIPATAVSGTVVPYFCNIHKQGMGEGQITVQ